MDARGFMGHDKSVRNGITDINYTVTIQSPAPEDKVRKCKEKTGKERWREQGHEVGVWRVIGESNDVAYVKENPCLRAGEEPAGSLLAFDAESGERRWRKRVRSAGEWSVGGETVVVVGSDGDLEGLDPATGDRRWERRSLRPVAGTDELVLVVDDQRDMADPSSLDTPGVVRAIDRSTGRRLWSYSSSRYLPLIQMEITVVRPDTAIVEFSGFGPGGPVGGQVSLDLETGEALWDVPQNMANLESEPGWPLLFGSIDGGQRIPLTAFDPRTREAQWVVPVPAQGVVAQSQRIAVSSVSGTPPRLTAHRIKDGRVEWSQDATSVGTVVASGGGIFLELVEADDFYAEGELVAIDAATGTTRWKASNPAGGLERWLVASSVYVSGGCFGAEPG